MSETIILNNQQFQKTLTHPGKGHSPQPGQAVKILYTLTLEDGKSLISVTDPLQPFKFILGQNQAYPALESIVQTMKLDEKAKITLSSDLFFDNQEPLDLIPAKTPLTLEITLLDVEKVQKSRWDLDEGERKAMATTFKIDGNEQFKKKAFSEAAVAYEAAMKYIEDDNGKEFDELKLSLYLNLALMNIKLREFSKAESAASKALELSPKHPKGLYRRGMARGGLNLHEEALVDLGEALALEPGEEIEKEIARVKEDMKKQREKDKKVYAKMFGTDA